MSLTLHKLGVADDEAFSFVQKTEKMAGQNVLSEIRVHYAKLAAQQRGINSLRWIIGAGFTALAILVTALALLD